MNRQTNTGSVKRSPLLWLIPAVGAIVIALILLLSLPKPVTAPVSGGNNLPDEITVTEAAQKLKDGTFILDVRQPDEWNQAHIDGAVLIPLDQLQSRLSEVPTDQEVVLVCRSGNRSAQGRDILRQSGYNQSTSMAGGMNDWIQQNLPTVSGQ